MARRHALFCKKNLHIRKKSSTFAADFERIQCMTVSAKAELKGNQVQILDNPVAVNSCDTAH